MGRKATYDQAKVKAEVCARISKGETLLEICRTPGMPERTLIYLWQDQDEVFAQQFARARDVGHDAIADHTVQIIDEPPERGPDGRIDPGYVAWQKNRAYQRMQLLAKWSPKKYGERTAIEHTGKVSLEGLIAASNDDTD